VTAWLRDRAYCTCVEVRNYSYDQAAEKLGIKARWLEDNIASLPHQKYGHNSAVFCDCELRLIQARHTRLPASAETPAVETDTASPVRTLRTITPSRKRKTSAV
jgi:hypothetical protein